MAESSLRSRLLQRESKVGAQHPNNFLASLPAKDFELLRPHLKPFEMVHEDLLFDAGDIVHWVYLPHSGVISLVVGLADGQLIEAAMVGRDSLVGGSVALDGGVALNRGIVQVEVRAEPARARHRVVIEEDGDGAPYLREAAVPRG